MKVKEVSSIKIDKIEPEKCVHNIKEKDCTLLFLEGFATMVYPPKKYGVCKYCGRSFEFIEEK